jgi:hypothetical protein
MQIHQPFVYHCVAACASLLACTISGRHMANLIAWSFDGHVALQMGIDATKTAPSSVIPRLSKPGTAADHAFRLSAYRSSLHFVTTHKQQNAVEKLARANRDTAHRHLTMQSSQGKLPFFWLIAGA